MNYNKISKIFKTSVGITIERHFINLKVEKAKELLITGNLSIIDIAWLLEYNSSQSFSTIFEKETGPPLLNTNMHLCLIVYSGIILW